MADALKEIVERVKSSAGIPEDKARSAVDAVVGYIKDKSPADPTSSQGARGRPSP
jgi:hypothetical protein